jgi:hypothetical protein
MLLFVVLQTVNVQFCAAKVRIMFTLAFWLFIALLGVLLYISPSFTIQRMYEPFEVNFEKEDADVSSLAMPAATTGGPRPAIQAFTNGALQQLETSYGPSPRVIPALPEGFENAPSSTVGPAPTQTDSVPAILGSQQQANAASPNALATPQQMSDLLKSLEMLTTPNLESPEVVLPSPTATLTKPLTSGAKPQPLPASTKKSQPSGSTQINDSQQSLKQGEAFKKTVPKSPEESKKCPPPRVIEKLVPRKCPPPRVIEKLVPRMCPPQQQCPDMSGYIRKDSIPCWGCKLK